MLRSRNFLLAALILFCLAPASQAQEPIRFARTPDISPDGKLVAFSYFGDIWVVEAIGGVARPITMHEKHDMMPVFSPDGRKIAFSSNRHGSYDVFVVSAQGGRPTRLTFDSADDFVSGWSPDGRYVLFSSSRSTSFPHNYEMYKVPVHGGRVERISRFEGREGVYSPSGDEIAYVRGPGTWYRKGYRGSSNDDIWICSADGSNNRQVTAFNGQDNAPMWAPDGRALYYVSEHFGTPANIVRQDMPLPPTTTLALHDSPRQITFHKDDAVRRARISGNGAWIVYECGPDLWVVSTKGGPPRKLAVEVHADDKTNPDRIVTYTSGVSEFAPSYDERSIAFVVHGSLFVMPRGGGKATRLTEGAHNDHGIAWDPYKARKIAFLSDRGGQEDVWLLESDDPDHTELAQAHKFKLKQLTNTPESESGLSFSPDGRRIAFLRAGKLVTMKPDGTDAKVVVDEGTVIDYEWSPDSKRLCYARMDGSFASELYIIPASGATAADPARNITRYATYNAGVTWSKEGGKLAFISERRGQPQSLYVLSLEKPGSSGSSSFFAGDIDWDEIHLRVEQPTPMHVLEGAINKDGTKVAFRSVQNGDDLWVASSDGRGVTRVTTGNLQPTQIQWSRTMSSLVYFKDASGQIHMVSSSITGSAPVVPFKAKLTIRRDEEFAEMFDQSWRALRDNFYDPAFHGVDWNAVRAKYRPLVKHVAMKEDLYNLIYLMLGELNASHLGIRGATGKIEENTADLGLIFDESFRGPGLRVAEVLKRGPADRRGLRIKPGDIVVSIDQKDLTSNTNISELLNGKVGETISLDVVTPAMGHVPSDPKARRHVEIQGTSRTQISNLMYDRWVENNAREVAKLSGGKLGYIHIPSMDAEGLDRFVRALYSDNFDKEAIVLDVRYNGGGYTHDRVLDYLGGKEHTVFHQRNGGEGLVLRAGDRKWTKPLVLLINNRSYSDAEIFPNAFRTLGLGKLVGQPTGAHVIGTLAIRLIDGSEFRVPRTGVFTAKGVNMEKHGVTPDFVVQQSPDEVARGTDAQLVKAVEVLREDVIAWKRARSGGSPAASAQGATPVVQPVPARTPAPAPPPSTKPATGPTER